jgi:hypothetical protein
MRHSAAIGSDLFVPKPESVEDPLTRWRDQARTTGNHCSPHGQPLAAPIFPAARHEEFEV